jgi:hypothetical protein
MAYTAKDFEKDLALYSAGAIIGVTRSRKFLEYAAKKGIQLAGFGARRAAVPAARGIGMAARRYPLTAAGIAGYGAYRAGVFDPVEEAIQMEVDRRIEEAQTGGANPIYGTLEDFARQEVPKRAKRKLTSFNKAVKSGMKAVKDSRYSGPKGTVKNPKVTLARIAKVFKAKKAGKKVSTKGETGVISRNIKRYIG